MSGTTAIGSIAMLALALGATASSEVSGKVAPSSCGDGFGPICEVTETCSGFWFWSRCQETRTYYPPLATPFNDASGGGGGRGF